MDKLLELAIELASHAHNNQFDKAGEPYINHPLRVMYNLATTEEKIVGVLHDAVEDSDLTLERLSDLGFPSTIVQAIESLTKRPKEKYGDYIERVKCNSLAVRVKLEDMRDNMEITRIHNPNKKDFDRLKKYQKVFPELLKQYNTP